MKKRIEFIDLAKGICIIMVVIGHSSLLTEPTFRMLRMPLYFVLSGLFFKLYSGIPELIIKKTNRLLLPTFAFIVPFSILHAFIIKTDGFSLFDYFFNWENHHYTVALWFLIALFEVNIIYALVNTLTKANPYLTGLLSFLLGGLGYYLITHGLADILLFNKALISLPFIYIGHQLKKTDILYKSKWDLPVAAVSLVLFFLLGVVVHLASLDIDMFHGLYQGHPLLLFPVTIGLVLCFLMMCKLINYIPYISYVGRYSIVILCIHFVVIGLLSRHHHIVVSYIPIQDTMHYNIFMFIVTLSISSLSIPICIKYFPYIFAQKDLFTYASVK